MTRRQSTLFERASVSSKKDVKRRKNRKSSDTLETGAILVVVGCLVKVDLKVVVNEEKTELLKSQDVKTVFE